MGTSAALQLLCRPSLSSGRCTPFFSVLSDRFLPNMYAVSSNWEDVLKVRRAMEGKLPGCSMVEVDGVACEFVAGDRSHPRMREIMSTVTDLDGQLRLFCWSEGYSELESYIAG